MLSKNFFEVGDQLTINDFNAIVSLYRKSVKHSEKIRITNDVFVGEYGVFEFNFDGATVLDNGVVVSDETISAIPRVRLTDNFFKASKYILQLDILHFTGMNILDDIAPENFKVVDVLEVELTANEWVEIPLDNIENGYIISFNANVLIDHDTPVLQGSWLNEIILSSDENMVQVGDTFILTAFAKDMADVGIVGEEITFYQKYKNSNVKLYPVGTEKFLDKAILNDYTSSWHNVSKKLKVTVENDGTLLEANTGYNGYYFANLEGSPTGSLPKVRDFKLPIIVEVDLVNVDETIINTSNYYGFGFNDSETHRIAFKDISPTGRHFKIVLDGVNAICYADNIEEPVIIPFELAGKVGASLMVANGSYLKFKNFKINETYNTVTDDTGNAICEITGEGSGVDKFYAKARNIESSKLDIIDGVLLDKATLLSYNDLFNNMDSFIRESDGTSVYYHNTGSSTYQLAFPNYMYFNGKEYAIDIELIENNYARLQVARYKTGSSNQYDAKVITGNGKIHIELLNDGIFWYQNDELIQSSTTKTNDERFSFFILTPTNQTSDFKYKNLIVYPVKIDEKLILSVNNQVISAYHSDTATITATYTKKGEGISGKSVTFKKGNTILDTVTTDANGEATYEYASNGDGDITITAECESLTENIVIEDCLYWNATEQEYNSTYYSGDHSIRLDENLSLVLTDDFEFSMECKSNINGSRLQLSGISSASSSASNYGFGFNRDSSGINTYYRTTSSNNWGSKISYDSNYHNVKFIRNGNNFIAYLDNVSSGTQTFDWWNTKSPYSLYWWVWKNGKITAKNIKIKKV